MKALRLLGQIGCCMALCAVFARADSIQLRNGRHLQGKYLGGTATTIGFMSGNTIDYFATSEVLAVIFDNVNDSPPGGLQPNPSAMKRPQRASRIAGARLIRVSTPDQTAKSKRATESNSPGGSEEGRSRPSSS